MGRDWFTVHGDGESDVMGAGMAVRVTTEDLETGETETKVVEAGDYLLTVVDPCYLAHVQAFGTGTHQLTVKGRTAPPAAPKE